MTTLIYKGQDAAELDRHSDANEAQRKILGSPWYPEKNPHRPFNYWAGKSETNASAKQSPDLDITHTTAELYAAYWKNQTHKYHNATITIGTPRLTWRKDW